MRKMTTGDAHCAKDTKVWFVLTLFKSDAPNKQVATEYKKDCPRCHIPAKADDWICVKRYPLLQATNEGRMTWVQFYPPLHDK